MVFRFVVFLFATFGLCSTEHETLDSYLIKHGYHLTAYSSDTNEGFCTKTQREVFAADLKNLQHVKSVAEIGFNGGHSCEIFFNGLNLEKFVSFDLNTHPYVAVGVDYIKKRFGERFQIITGDSNRTVNEFANAHSNEKFDLIYIDGGHSYECCYNDIINCRRLAHGRTIVWVDDYNNGCGVKAAVNACISRGIIRLDWVKEVQDPDGVRTWVQVCYL